MKTYSGNEVTFNFAGLNIGEGRGADEFVRIEGPDDVWTVRQGIDGEVTRSKNPAQYVTVTVTLSQTSADNDLLMAQHLLDLSTPGGFAAPILVSDRLGTALLAGADAWIVKTPDQTFAREAGDVEWVFGVANPQRFVGGH
jgi:hypothetical protein